MNKPLTLLLPIILVSSLFIAIQTIPSSHAATTGLVCVVAPATATGCPSSPPTIGPLTVGQTFTVGVFVQNSDPMGGFDIYVMSDTAVLNPTKASLGNLIAGPSLTSICIDGAAQVGSCTTNTANGPGVVEVTTIESSGSNECNNTAPCSGLAFNITYSIIGTSPSTTLSYPTAPGCSTSSISSTTDVCVLVDDSFGNALPETDQGATVTQNAVRDPTSSFLMCSPSSTAISSAVTCTATVNDTATPSKAPGGTVTFATNSTGNFNPSVGICSLTQNPTNSTCIVTYSPTVVGHHNITISYSPDSSHFPSQGSFNLQATPAPKGATSITVQCTPAQLPNDTATECVAIVTDISSNPTPPKGSVLFQSDGPGTFMPAVVSGGMCILPSTVLATSSCSVSYTPTRQGVQMITGQYSGDSGHTSVSGSFGIDVTVQSLATTTTSVNCSPSPVMINTGSVCTATVRDISMSPTNPTGTVSFTTNSAGSFSASPAHCSLTPSGSDAAKCTISYTPSGIGSGTHSIGSGYSGDSTHGSSTAADFALIVVRSSPTITSTVSPASIRIGSSATDLATLSGGFNPSGMVTYKAYSDSACTMSVFSPSNVPLGSPSNPFTPPSAGTYYFIANYSGDANNNAASTTCGESGETLAVTQPPTDTTTTSVVCSPSTISIDASTTCSATVTDTSSSLSSPTGSVSFATGSTGTFNPSSCILAPSTSSAASCSVSYNPGAASVGTHSLTVDYSGDSHHSSSAGTTPLTVSAAAPTAPLTILGLSSEAFYAIVGVILLIIILVAFFALRRRRPIRTI